MHKVTVSAPGKLMLLGEHSVVYNRPCIVTAVGQRMFVTVERIEDKIFELNAPDVDIKKYKKAMEDLGEGEIPKGAKFVEIAVKNFKDKYFFKGGLKIKTKSEFSSKFGFGSSSASTVCVIKALSILLKGNLTDKQIFDLAYKTVLEVQGSGSGFDVAAAIYGGTLYFVTGGKKIEPLKLKDLPLIVGYTGIKADTPTIVKVIVGGLKEKYPKVVTNIFNQITDLVEQAKKAVIKKDWETVGQLMNINQGLLSSLGVSIRKLEDMIYAARDNGAYGAKLSGAGGGDCMIFLAPQKKKAAISRAIAKVGGKVINVKANVKGVRVER